MSLPKREKVTVTRSILLSQVAYQVGAYLDFVLSTERLNWRFFSPIWDLVSCGIILLSVCLVPHGGSVAGRIKFAGGRGMYLA